jgi:hypothetical protein
MPIFIEGIDQGTPEWLALRLGIPSASRFQEIVTTTGIPSKSRKKYMYELAGERITGEVKESKRYGSMQMGIDREPEARECYQFLMDTPVKQVTFVYLDESRSVGCSPDGLVEPNGGFENKNAEPHVQICRHEEGWSKAEHFQQVQGGLWICAREWWDLQSYCRGTKPIITRYYRDERFIATLAAEIRAFNEELDEMVKRLS